MLEFSKYQAGGNDFVIVDNRSATFDEFATSLGVVETVKRICSRRFGVGADGLILLEHSRKADFAWRFFNSDGSQAHMCGNGARCIARFAVDRKITGREVTFETPAGAVKAWVKEKTVKVQLPRFSPSETALNVKGVKGYYVEVGVPHFVVVVENVDTVDVESKGRSLRFAPEFSPEGVNVDFVECKGSEILVRTYERGVEGETYACGTGSVACAFICMKVCGLTAPLKVRVKSGETLTVYFENGFSKPFLEGKVIHVYEGFLKGEILYG